MIKIICGSLALFMLFFAGIDTFIGLSRSQKIKLTKLLGYIILCSLLTIIAVATIIVLF